MNKHAARGALIKLSKNTGIVRSMSEYEVMSLHRNRLNGLIAFAVIGVLSILEMSMSSFSSEEGISVIEVAIMLLTNAVGVAVVVYVTEGRNLSWFSILWRAYVSFLLSIIPIAVFVSMQQVASVDEITSDLLLIVSVIQVLSVALIAWLLFSVNRAGQMRRLASVFRRR